ncbi:MAG: RNA polymerase sigma factor [Opitutaceae bacterium]|nr:RNA polymerase sigma factor [Opitutaceae bacterium]
MNPPTASDLSLVADQTQWFSEEVHPYDSQLRAYLRGSFPSVRDVEDVVQESYLRLWRRQLTAPIRSAKSFLYKVARHLAIDSLRHTRRSPFDDVADLARLSVLDPAPHAAEAACTNEELDLLLTAIESLPPRCREIVILRKLRGLSQKEIARHMGITARTVEVQGCKGLDRCEQFLRARGVTRNPLP